MNEKFKIGFLLENPEIVLEWGKPLDELAKKSGGVWHEDRYIWKSVTYLQGLKYPLCSENGIAQNEPFTSVSAYIGLNSEGLWSDELSLSGFDKVSDHLVKLLGKPTKTEVENEAGEKSQSWDINGVNFYLNVIEQHVLKCYLTINSKL